MIREFTSSELFYLVLAVRWTLALSAIALVGGALVGLGIALLRISNRRAVRIAGRIYIRVFQGTPLLMQLFLIYFGGSIIGMEADAWTSAALGLTLYSSAFLGEIWRGCIEAVPSGQWDGARSLALPYHRQLRLVILPQAARIAIAPTVGFAVQAIKSTSLASVIGFVELTRAAQIINNATFRPALVYLTVAALYFLLCWPLSVYSERLERRMGSDRARVPAVSA
ncbi:amino acid ABC transporter permease (plasmid) [Bosea vestrisii]|uniref:amino acid ABC transporter permease n=1 Tax=Bosea vestrisii TaxID=151416 RepID=UPI0024DF4B2E|nr:amino acid ABC transporter permease [Bosea vestrisii]WID99656.1 amino acid ABC transporter permease [Bosea vestrisii]